MSWLSCPSRFDHLRASAHIYRTVVGICTRAFARLFTLTSRGMSRNAVCLWFWAGFPPSRTIFGRFSKSGSEFWLGKISCPTVYKRRVRVLPTASKYSTIVACVRLTLQSKTSAYQTHSNFRLKLFLHLKTNAILIYSLKSNRRRFYATLFAVSCAFIQG